MKLFFLLILFSPVILAQRQHKSTNPNDEPFLPIFPDYPYNPKLLKRGIEQQQQLNQIQQGYRQPSSELYAPKPDAIDSYTPTAAPNTQNSFFGSYDTYSKTSPTAAATSLPAFYPGSNNLGFNFNSSPLNLLSSFSNPFVSPFGLTPPNGFGTQPTPNNFGGVPQNGPNPSAVGSSIYPNYYPQPPLFYPSYFNYPYPLHPQQLGYQNPLKHFGEGNDEEDRRNNAKYNGYKKNHLRSPDKEIADNSYIDGANYIIASPKDLDSESSTHKTPASYNQIEDSDLRNYGSLPKATFRLVAIKTDPNNPEYPDVTGSYVKVTQLEQIMKQAIQKLLAQNNFQQNNLVQDVNQGNQPNYITIPSNLIKPGSNYVINPTVLNRVNNGQYASQFLQNQALLAKNHKYIDNPQKSTTSVTLQQSPGIYIPPSIKTTNNNNADQNDYGDYDTPESVTFRNSQTPLSNSVTPLPSSTRTYVYSTYRPTQKTSLDDVNFESKSIKNKS